MRKTNEKKNGRNRNTSADKITLLLLLSYLVLLVWILLFKLNMHFTYMGHWSNFNLIPYHQPLMVNGKISVSEIMMNILIFIPLGIYVGILWRSWTILPFILGVSFFIEVFQFILSMGAFDITDIINNTLGGILGVLFYLGFEKATQNKILAQKIINIAAALTTILFVFLILFLKMNKLLMFRR